MTELTIYAGYGANTNHAHMAQRCPGAQYIGNGILEHWRLEFRGVADVVPYYGETCEVALWEIKSRHLRALDRFEGYPRLYQRTLLPVTLPGGALEIAVVYIMAAARDLSVPGEGYHDALRDGYDDCGIDGAQIGDAVRRAERNGGLRYTSRLWDNDDDDNNEARQ